MQTRRLRSSLHVVVFPSRHASLSVSLFLLDGLDPSKIAWQQRILARTRSSAVFSFPLCVYCLFAAFLRDSAGHIVIDCLDWNAHAHRRFARVGAGLAFVGGTDLRDVSCLRILGDFHCSFGRHICRSKFSHLVVISLLVSIVLPFYTSAPPDLTVGGASFSASGWI